MNPNFVVSTKTSPQILPVMFIYNKKCALDMGLDKRNILLINFVIFTPKLQRITSERYFH